MNKNHEFGFNLEEDLKALYGENYEGINKMRKELFSAMDNEPLEIRQLRNIIQNPVSIDYRELKEWKDHKNEVIKEYSINCKTISIINLIETFVIMHHM